MKSNDFHTAGWMKVMRSKSPCSKAAVARVWSLTKRKMRVSTCASFRCLDRHGESAPAGDPFKFFGFTVERVSAAVRAVVANGAISNVKE